MSNRYPPYGDGDDKMEDAFVEVFRQTKIFGRIVLTMVILILLFIAAIAVGALVLAYKAVF